jgi:hypothetical protein
MRTISVLLALSLALAGCEDAIGFGSTCAAEMRNVRRNEGGPPSNSTRTSRNGDFTEVWRYSNGGTRIYEFRWGVSYERCRVSGPMTTSQHLGLTD